MGIPPLPTGIRVQQFPLSAEPNARESLNVLGMIVPPEETDGEGLVVLGRTSTTWDKPRMTAYYPGAMTMPPAWPLSWRSAHILQRHCAQLRRPVVIAFFGAEETE